MDVMDEREVRELLDASLLLESRGKARAFFRDLFTESGLREFANRWQTAQLLHHGNSYSEIEERTGLSSTTVARISKWLQQGAGGYRAILAKMEARKAREK